MDPLPNPNTPILEDKPLLLTLAALISMVLAHAFGVAISPDVIAGAGGLLISLYTVFSKLKSAKVATANTAAISAQQVAVATAAQLPHEVVRLPDGKAVVAVGADSIANLKAHVFATTPAGAAPVVIP